MIKCGSYTWFIFDFLTINARNIAIQHNFVYVAQLEKTDNWYEMTFEVFKGFNLFGKDGYNDIEHKRRMNYETKGILRYLNDATAPARPLDKSKKPLKMNLKEGIC